MCVVCVSYPTISRDIVGGDISNTPIYWQYSGLAGANTQYQSLRSSETIQREVLTCNRAATLCVEEGNRQSAAHAGLLEAVVAAMRAHPQVAGVQEQG